MGENVIKSVDELKTLQSEVQESGSKFMFRGQNQDFPLLPGIARNDGINLELESSFFQEFKHRTHLAFFETQREEIVFPKNDFEWLSLGQHYGLRTRCLDWTQKMRVALFFATDGAYDQEGVLYSYELPGNFSQEWLPLGHRDLTEKTPFNFENIKIFHPPSFLDMRIDNQFALLTVHPYPWKRMESLEIEGELKKYVIPSIHKKSIFDDLDKTDLNYEYLFGGIEGICRSINARN